MHGFKSSFTTVNCVALDKWPALSKLISLSATTKIIENPTSGMVGLVSQEDSVEHLAGSRDSEVAAATLMIRKVWTGLVGTWSQNQGNRGT